MLDEISTATHGQEFVPLPYVLLLNVLDQLVETCNDHPSIHISPMPKRKLWEDDWTPSIRLPAIIILFHTIGPNVKGLHLNLDQFILTWNDAEIKDSYTIDPSVYSHMFFLGNLIICCYTVGHFPSPPPNIKRPAMVTDHFADAECNFYQFLPSLESSVFLRSHTMMADDVDTIVGLYQGESLDMILIGMGSYYPILVATRDWKPDHMVRIWKLLCH